MDLPELYGRSRVRGPGEKPQTTHITWNTNGDTPPTGSYPYTWQVLGDYHLIQDNPHRLRHSTFGWKYPPGRVYHDDMDTTRLRPMTGRLYTEIGSPFTNYFDFPSTGTFPPLTAALVNSITPSIPDADFYTLNREAFNYFSDAFPPQMSFSEFIVGLRDLRELLPEIQASIAKSFSGGYLNKEFGWDNLLSDLNVLGGLLDEVKARNAWLRDIYGQPFKAYFSRANLDPLTPALGATASLTGTWVSNASTIVTLTAAKVNYHASCTILETLDYLDSTVGLIRGLAGALGLDNPIKALWVNLPFSFVVDWFFRISDHLDTLTRANPSTGWDISNVTCSLKVHSEFDVVYNYPADDHFGRPAQVLNCGKVVRDQYKRFLGLPLSLVDLLPTSELSPTQLTLLLALLHQQG